MNKEQKPTLTQFAQDVVNGSGGNKEILHRKCVGDVTGMFNGLSHFQKATDAANIIVPKAVVDEKHNISFEIPGESITDANKFRELITDNCKDPHITTTNKTIVVGFKHEETTPKEKK